MNRKKAIIKTAILLILAMSFLTGCGDSGITKVDQKDTKPSASGKTELIKKAHPKTIELGVDLKFNSSIISDSKLLESNLGNDFGHISEFEVKLEAGEEFNLESLQLFGIFALYVSSDGPFEISSSSGINITVKTLLLDKCSFKDLKIKNSGSDIIQVKGVVGGE